MAAAQLATWMLEQEARAMLGRLNRVKPFAVQETMLPAAALSPAAQAGIERHLIDGRRVLRRQIRRYIAWLRGIGASAATAEQQRRFTFLRLRFNLALSQLDLFSDAITQRSENETGLWLSGLDVAAQDALDLPGGYFRAPPVVCYLHRGLGGAIRRARTRLPGGGENPVSIVRIPRERMIGYLTESRRHFSMKLGIRPRPCSAWSRRSAWSFSGPSMPPPERNWLRGACTSGGSPRSSRMSTRSPASVCPRPWA